MSATESSSQPARRRGRPAQYLVAIVVLALCVVGVTYGLHRLTSNPVNDFKTGDCVAHNDGHSPPYKFVTCTDSAASYTVLAVVDRDATLPCRAVAGASILFDTDKTIVCLGVKGVDPAKAINVATDGDCVDLELRDAYRVPCSDPKATYQIIKRLTNVPHTIIKDECAGVPGTTRAYAWNWTSSSPLDVTGLTDDVVLCLKQGPGPGIIASSASASNSNCRFITNGEMSAAVSKATGKTYTVKSHSDGSFGCDYRFAKAGDYVEVDWSPGLAFDPGTGSDVFTVNGLKAMWDPGEGDRVLSVKVPDGMFSIVMRLSGEGSSLARKVAVAVFQPARPQLP